VIHRAKDLSPDQRLTIERLIGQTLSEQDNISVRKLSPPAHLSPERRQQILNDLQAYFSQIDAQRQPMSDDEADELINEALRSTRPNYRPVR
jgi:hypothetical protein